MQFIIRAGLIGAGLLGAAVAETGETAEPGDDTSIYDDTGIYNDTGAEAERVFVQDVGCGSAAFALPLALGALLLPRSRR